jgi:voltage-gated potassium channel
MEFTFTFIKLFTYGIALAAPLLLSFALAIIIIGQIVGRRESWNRLDSLYWSFITATTVGYGDIRPTQKLTKILSIVIAFIGLVFTGITVALAINAATAAFSKHNDITNLKQNIQQVQ